MVMMTLRDIFSYSKVWYSISGLWNHLIYHRHKKINKTIFGANLEAKVVFCFIIAEGKDLVFLVGNSKLEASDILRV